MIFRVGSRDTFHSLKRIQLLEHLIPSLKLVSLADKPSQAYSFIPCSIFLVFYKNLAPLRNSWSRL